MIKKNNKTYEIDLCTLLPHVEAIGRLIKDLQIARASIDSAIGEARAVLGVTSRKKRRSV